MALEGEDGGGGGDVVGPRPKRVGPVETTAEPTPGQRVSAAVASLGLLYVVPSLWTLVVLVGRRGPGRRFERSYAWSALLFHIEGLALVALLCLPVVVDDGRTPGLLAFPALVALGLTMVTLFGAVSALVGSGFAWPSLPGRRAGTEAG